MAIRIPRPYLQLRSEIAAAVNGLAMTGAKLLTVVVDFFDTI